MVIVRRTKISDLRSNVGPISHNSRMSDSLDEAIRSKFKEYRSRYTELSEYYAKKKKPLSIFGNPLKIKGEIFTSNALMGEKFDYAFHNCGKTSYPENLQNNSWYQDQECHLNSVQRELLEQAFSKFVFKEAPFRYEFENYRGLWPWGISAESMERKENVNFTGQFGDYLSLCVEDYFEIIENLFDLKEFKRITANETDGDSVISLIVGNSNSSNTARNLDPLERKGQISSYFMKLFLSKYFVCEHFEEKTCRLCGNDFWPQMGGEWAGRVPPEYCSICLEMAFSGSTEFFRLMSYSDEERNTNFVFGIKAFSDFFGLIPRVGTAKRRMIMQLRRTGVSGEDLDLALMASSLLPWHETAKKMFGTWAHLLEAAELLEHRQRGRGGHQSIASDGHLCLSMGERAICEYLTRKSIVHSKEPLYPSDEKLNPNGLLRGDFLVGSIFIEYAGMMSNKEYAERMSQKSKLAKLKGIPWIKVEGSQLEDLDLMLVAIEEKTTM